MNKKMGATSARTAYLSAEPEFPSYISEDRVVHIQIFLFLIRLYINLFCRGFMFNSCYLHSYLRILAFKTILLSDNVWVVPH